MSPLVQGLYHQTWQGGDVCWQEATYGVTRLFDYADLWSHIKNLKRNISKTYDPKAWQVKGLHPENKTTIDHLSFVTLNLYKINKAIDNYDANFII